jgi:ABC-type Fe3+/spermidine/putrescine transport system ATPase subunit
MGVSKIPNIELKSITKTFDEGKVLAVDNISLEIKEGDYVFLLGPSGCGKTTTLRMIAGLEEPHLKTEIWDLSFSILKYSNI